MVAIILFTSQVASRTFTYFEHHTNTELQVVYDTKIPFPAITVCNQNNFRYGMAFHDIIIILTT